MNTSPTRALVLAGAGAAGNAWQLGLVAGLAEAGIDLTTADLTIGTSAGSTAAAQITGERSPAELYAAMLAEVPPPNGARAVAQSGDYMGWSQAIIDASSDVADMRRRMGAAALERDDADSATRWRSVVERRLPGARWPRQLVRITAVDAVTGEPAFFDRDSGVDLIDAVAASTSNGYAGTYPIGSRRFINGGYRRNENADLAAGYDRVLILAPFSGRTRQPLAWGMDLATQVAELRAGGSVVETVFPDETAGDVFNVNAMDPATRRQAAVGGFGQGRNLADHLVSL